MVGSTDGSEKEAKMQSYSESTLQEMLYSVELMEMLYQIKQMLYKYFRLVAMSLEVNLIATEREV